MADQQEERGTVQYADGRHPAIRHADGTVTAAESRTDGPYVAWRKVNSRIAATFRPDGLHLSGHA